MKTFLQPVARTDKSYLVFEVADPPKHREAEWAFDAKDAAAILLDYKKMVEEKKHLMNFIQEVRFVKADSYALSPCYGRDSVWVGCYLIGNQGWEELRSDFETLAMRYKGRPHWGKEFSVSSQYLAQQYLEWGTFMALKKEWDRDKKFDNAFLTGLFGSE